MFFIAPKRQILKSFPFYKIPALMQKYNHFECYSTFFHYLQDILRYMKENIVSNCPSVSGYKGFHIMLDIRIFGKVMPSKYLHVVFSKLRYNLIKQLKLDDVSAFDMTIRDRVRFIEENNYAIKYFKSVQYLVRRSMGEGV